MTTFTVRRERPVSTSRREARAQWAHLRVVGRGTGILPALEHGRPALIGGAKVVHGQEAVVRNISRQAGCPCHVGPPTTGRCARAQWWSQNGLECRRARDHIGRMSASTPGSRQVVLLVGTVKGLFLYQSDERRTEWTLSGPHLGGWEVFSVCGDTRNGRILAGTGHYTTGPTIRTSKDLGATWEGVERDPRFAEGAKAELKHIWQIVPGHASQPGTWYAGVDDAALFVSRDDARTWDELTGLTNHPTRPRWMPGFGGLCLHSIVVDAENPRRLWVGISAVGVFRSDDAGESWKLCNAGLPNVAPEFVKDEDMGRCVHKLAADPAKPCSLAMQYHGGVFTSQDGAESWQRVSAGLPHDFGFPLAATQRDLFVVPLLADDNRVVPGGALKVWRSRDRGKTWRALTNGLPQKEYFVGVLRDAMTADPLTPSGVYLGTTGGELFYSRDDGESWEKLPARFPRITNLKVWLR